MWHMFGLAYLMNISLLIRWIWASAGSAAPPAFLHKFKFKFNHQPFVGSSLASRPRIIIQISDDVNMFLPPYWFISKIQYSNLWIEIFVARSEVTNYIESRIGATKTSWLLQPCCSDCLIRFRLICTEIFLWKGTKYPSSLCLELSTGNLSKVHKAWHF